MCQPPALAHRQDAEGRPERKANKQINENSVWGANVRTHIFAEVRAASLKLRFCHSSRLFGQGGAEEVLGCSLTPPQYWKAKEIFLQKGIRGVEARNLMW